MGRVEALWRHVKGARQWPGIATPRLMARTAGCCLFFGGIVVTLLGALASANFRVIEVIYLNAAVAISLGTVTLVLGSRLRSWQFHVIVVVGTVLITLSVNVAGTPATTVSLATLYALVAFAAFFVSWPQAAAHLALAVVCCMAVLAHSAAVPWWSAVIAASTTAVMGAVIATFGQLMSNAERDTVTGLPNRQGVLRLLDREIDLAKAGGPHPTVVLLRLDVFDHIDNRLGHLAGDQLIRNTVEAWLDCLGPDDVLARLGGDEFAVLLPGALESDGVALSAGMRAAASTDCSAGVTAWHPDEAAVAVLSRADVALRRARRGPNQTMVESSDLPTLASELAEAIAADAVEVLYQPIVSLTDGHTIVGVEALARWESPTRPDVAISEVITIAENSNLIATLDRFVLRRACTDAQWLQQRYDGSQLTLTVNVSGLDLIEKGYAAAVAGILDSTGWPADQLVLEVTESVVEVDTPSSVAVLGELRTHGIRVAIDDFGTGYSTLSRLQNLPIDLLKLDASFTARITLDPSSGTPPLLQAIAALARALELPVVIEGVETEHQALALQHAGFAMAQGYYFGRPQVRERLVNRLTVA